MADIIGMRILRNQRTTWDEVARLSDKDHNELFCKELVRMEKQELLIIDDFGMQPLDAQSRAILMEIIEDRHGKRSMLFTSQVPVNNWYEVIGEQTVADAILDRIIHDAHRLELHGDSMRKRKETLPPETPEKSH